MGEDPGDVADELRSHGISIIAIGGGGYKKNKRKLNRLGGGSDLAFQVDSFEELKDFHRKVKITERTCSECEFPLVSFLLFTCCTQFGKKRAILTYYSVKYEGGSLQL